MFRICKRNILLIEKNLLKKRSFASNEFEKMPVFKSSYSLDNIYPKTQTGNTSNNLKLESDGKQFNGYIPINKLSISYSRSGGPGGQHVNTTETKVTVQFHLSSADWIPTEVKQRLTILHKNSINKEGFWTIRSDKTRIQLMNLADCMDKIRCYITEASKPIPKPSFETLEMIRERREKAAINRLQQKKIRSVIKSDRNSID